MSDIKIIYAPTVTLISEPKFIEPNHLQVNWLGESTDGEKLVEYSGRLCYMSQHNPAKKETYIYIQNILEQQHGSVIEHANYSFLLEGVSRSLTHELVRHRIMSYSQLSQRFVDESEAGFVIPPSIIGFKELEEDFKTFVNGANLTYKRLFSTLDALYTPLIENRLERRKKAREAARSVLPNSVETKIVVTANIRAWRHVLEMRSSPHAEREIRRLAVLLVEKFKKIAPIFFQDFEIIVAEDGLHSCNDNFKILKENRSYFLEFFY